MHASSWSVAVLVTAAAAVMVSGAADKVGKSSPVVAASQTSSLEDELESSLPQPQQPQQQQPQQQQPQQPQQQQAAPRQQKPAQQQPPHHRPHQEEQQKSRRPSRTELRQMFHELLESMTEAERKSLTLRLGGQAVKRTFDRLRDEARPVAPAALMSKRATPPMGRARGAALRMRRSLLRASMESGMSAARQRRKKRDLVDYSPEEYAQLAALLAGEPSSYVEDADGNIRLRDEVGEDFEGDSDDGSYNNDDGYDGDNGGGFGFDGEAAGEAEEGEGDVEKKRDSLEDAAANDDDDDQHGLDFEERGSAADNLFDAGDFGDNDVGEAGAGDLMPMLLPPPPPPPPPMTALEEPEPERKPLTMFLVRMAGEKGLFVPLDQDGAQRLAVDLAGEAAIAEAAEAQAEAEAEERSRQEAGVAELKRFAEKLARRVPPGY